MEAANPEANIIFGATFTEDFEDEMRVTVIATGFDDQKKPEGKGIFSNAGAARSTTTSRPGSTAAAPVDTAANIDDIDEIFKIFNK